MVGFYNVSVILTYCGLASSVMGIFLAMSGRITFAVICLMLSGICDMFDGKVARAIKRSDDEKRFGIQIDSLCDMVCFGVLPAVLCRSLGVTGVVGTIVLVAYILAGLIRLAYYNVTEEHRQDETSETRRFYRGLPVTTISFLFPVLYCFRVLLAGCLPAVLTGFMLLVAFLFVLNVKVIKPGGKASHLLIALFILAFVAFVVLVMVEIISPYR